jgi:hypothetical protein
MDHAGRGIILGVPRLVTFSAATPMPLGVGVVFVIPHADPPDCLSGVTGSGNLSHSLH